MDIRHDWTREEIEEIFNLPLMELVYKASEVHRKYHEPGEILVNQLISVKTGACTEDCAYCAQSIRYKTKIQVHKLMSAEEVYQHAVEAKESGANRVCLSSAWREIRDNRDFPKILDMVKKVKALGLEVCLTMGMLTEEQAKKLKEAGLDTYNHNLDTSPEYYSKIITTRTYEDRLNTIKNVQKAGINVCSGGIIGLGEKIQDRIGLLHVLSNLDPHPESVPINMLVPIPGTPLEDNTPPDVWELLRMVATARIIMPKSIIRLSAGREKLSYEAQALCFFAGANSIFSGEKLLTVPNSELQRDRKMFQLLGLKPKSTRKNEPVKQTS